MRSRETPRGHSMDVSALPRPIGFVLGGVESVNRRIGQRQSQILPANCGRLKLHAPHVEQHHRLARHSTPP